MTRILNYKRLRTVSVPRIQVGCGLLSVLLGLLLLFHGVPCRAGEPVAIAWQELVSKHTVIRYQSQDDLQRFHASINFGESRFSLQGLFAAAAPTDLVQQVVEKVDFLFVRVRELLDMRKKMERVTIELYRDRQQLDGAYAGIYDEPSSIRAWYRYRTNTVYLNVRDMHEGILAHELAHAVIDHFFLVRPPIATAEILARHVDSHLK